MTDMTDASSERMMTPELMITGEAVALEIIPASVGSFSPQAPPMP